MPEIVEEKNRYFGAAIEPGAAGNPNETAAKPGVLAPAIDYPAPSGGQQGDATLELRFDHGKIRVLKPGPARLAASESALPLGDDEILNGSPGQNARRLLLDALLSE